MKVYSKIDFWFLATITFTIVISVVSGLFIPSNEVWIYLLFVLPMIFLLLWITFKTYYQLTETHLICKSGPFKEKIAYEQIASLALKENFLSSMALSTKRIEIKRHKGNVFTKTTYISPVDREQFLDELQYYCKNLKND